MRLQALLLLTLLLPPVMAPCAAIPSAPGTTAQQWTDYLGNQQRGAPWAGFLRGVGLMETGLGAVRDRIPARGEPMPDFALLRERVSAAIAEHDVVMPVGGLVSGRRQSHVDTFMQLIERDQGATWRDLVRTQAAAIAGLPGGRERVYWQIGNEINSRHYSLSLRTYADAPGGDRDEDAGQRQAPRMRPRFEGADPAPGRQRRLGGMPNDEFIISYYVEYFLAPTVQAIDEASRDLFGAPGRINIMLGSLANSSSPAAQRWLDLLLDYTIEGRFAPAIKGRKVHEFIDIISIHYLVSYPGDEWRQVLGDIEQRWWGKGRVRGTWSTEELGRRRAMGGMGGVSSVQVSLRYLDWAAERALGPRQVRVNFWGGELGPPDTTAERNLTLLHDFLGDTRLRIIPKTQFQPSGPGGEVLSHANRIEGYGFATQDGRRGIFGLFRDGRSGGGRLHALHLDRAFAPIRSARLLIFAAEGTRIVSVRLERDGEGTLLVPESAPDLGADITALFLVEWDLAPSNDTVEH